METKPSAKWKGITTNLEDKFYKASLLKKETQKRN